MIEPHHPWSLLFRVLTTPGPLRAIVAWQARVNLAKDAFLPPGFSLASEPTDANELLPESELEEVLSAARPSN
jgi:hypothetical protein